MLFVFSVYDSEFRITMNVNLVFYMCPFWQHSNSNCCIWLILLKSRLYTFLQWPELFMYRKIALELDVGERKSNGFDFLPTVIFIAVRVYTLKYYT